MLVRMQINWMTHTLPVGMKNGTTPLKNNLTVLTKLSMHFS